MSESVLDSLKILFLLGFTLHNLEEAVWLPKWSKFAKKFHEPVKTDQFTFAVIIITIVGYVLTALDILFGNIDGVVTYLYLGFIGMMGVNSIFPHLISTIIIKKYAPGLITGMLLNLPFSFIIVMGYINKGVNVLYLIVAIIVVSSLILFSLKYLFKLGKILILYSD